MARRLLSYLLLKFENNDWYELSCTQILFVPSETFIIYTTGELIRVQDKENVLSYPYVILSKVDTVSADNPYKSTEGKYKLCIKFIIVN